MENTRGKLKDLTGMRFGWLTVVSRAENSKQGKPRWNCVCDCGKLKEKPTLSYDLISGKVSSCGCKHKIANAKKNKTHGMKGSRIYNIWSTMKRRCNVVENYVKKGITVCSEWNNFEAFYKWAMENGYSESLTLDRIDNYIGYCPENCRWVTMEIQQNNRTNNRIVIYKNEKFTVSELAKNLGVPSATLLWRINAGWSNDQLNLKPNYNNKKIRRINYEHC